MTMSHNVLYVSLLQDLSEAGLVPFGDVSSPPPEASPRRYAAYALRDSLLKKFEGVTNVNADDAALEKFLSANDRCGNWRLDLRDLRDELLFGAFRAEVFDFFRGGSCHGETFDSYDAFLLRGKCGPGASVKTSGRVDFYSKMFDGPLSCTSSFLQKHYQFSIRAHTTWLLAEETRQARWGLPKLVEGSTLSYVPKNESISRTICVEPTLNMYYQLGFGSLIEDRLREVYHIDIATQQDRQRELARVGSLDGSVFTMDLSSASDTISLKMLEAVLPPVVLGVIKQLRSSTVTLPCGRQVSLEMVSSMGNGFTFPLETAIFSCAVSAALKISGAKGPFGVFGDDIIAPTACYSAVARLLEILGFKINADKSFETGPFRESCGGDYYHGYPVRGVYIKRLANKHDAWSAINRLNEWSAFHRIPLTRAIRVLKNWCPFQFIPMHEDINSGIRLPFSQIPDSYWAYAKKRKLLYWCRKTFSWRYTMYMASARRWSFVDGIVSGPRSRGVAYNPHGLMLAFLNGTVRDGYITLRPPMEAGVKMYPRGSFTSAWDQPVPAVKDYGLAWSATIYAVNLSINYC